jgi:hypothetical protein
MYFVVPKVRSIIKWVAKAEDCYTAQQHAESLHKKTGEHFDVIRMSNVYTTQTLAELLEQDMILAGEGFAA